QGQAEKEHGFPERWAEHGGIPLATAWLHYDGNGSDGSDPGQDDLGACRTQIESFTVHDRLRDPCETG
ncbi:MAG: hypothetical protein WD396_09545, partial [Pseudohongiellaceae bacterium]